MGWAQRAFVLSFYYLLRHREYLGDDAAVVEKSGSALARSKSGSEMPKVLSGASDNTEKTVEFSAEPLQKSKSAV